MQTKTRYLYSTHILEWPISRILTTPHADKMRSNLHSLLVGMQYAIATLEDRFLQEGRFLQNKMYCYVKSTWAFWYTPKGIENISSQEFAYGQL